MPDEPQKADLALTWKQVIRDICQALIAIASLAGIWLANHNSDKINEVKTTQQEVKQETAESAKEIKTTLDQRGAKLDKDAAEKKKEDEKQRLATASMLYGNWKYLLDNAVSSDDIKEAANAKRRYDEFTKNGK